MSFIKKKFQTIIHVKVLQVVLHNTFLRKQPRILNLLGYHQPNEKEKNAGKGRKCERKIAKDEEKIVQIYFQRVDKIMKR